MNITQAVAAKLKGTNITCKRCKHSMYFYPRKNPDVVSYCTKHQNLKFDNTLCNDFQTEAQVRRRHNMQHSVVLASSNLEIGKVAKYQKEYEELCST
jgi:hypothetical protein